MLARLLRERRRFVVVTTVARGLSLIPAIATPDDTPTKIVLVGIHLLAAVIIISTLSQQLVAIDPNTIAARGYRKANRSDLPRR